MKTTKERKPKPSLKVKKESKTGESSLNKAVKNVKEILKNKTEAKAAVERKIKKKSKNIGRMDDFIKIDGVKGRKLLRRRINEESEEKPKLERGVIYLGHIPHGFYETQMKDYFSQFGRVTRVRVSRSQLTGRSKGYGFVEFAHPDVAKVAAESMNNYLMCGRLVKAEYIPPEKQHNNYFRGPAWSIFSHPKIKRRMKAIRRLNSTVLDENHKIFVENSIKKLKKLSEVLKSEGIDLKMKLGDVEI